MPGRLTVIADLIFERPLCLSCVARKAEIPSADVLETLLERLRHVLTVQSVHERCRSCGLITTVISVTRRA
jgi:hypothetical protein